MKLEKRPVLVTDRGEQLDSDHAHHIMQLIAALRKAPILSETVPISQQAALRIVEALIKHKLLVDNVINGDDPRRE
jgi:hypothetical protein